MVAASTIILEYVCPGLGIILGNVMFSAPIKDVRLANQRGYLGELNPLPWVFTLGNCTGWVAYACLTDNLWILFANAPALIFSVWLNTSAAKLKYIAHRNRKLEENLAEYLAEQRQLIGGIKPSTSPLADDSSGEEIESAKIMTVEELIKRDRKGADADVTPNPQERALVAVVTFWVAILALISFWDSASQETLELVVGSGCILNLVFFYGAPLSSIFTVLKTRDSSSIHAWTMMTNTFNGAFWCAYGLAIFDPFVFAPNGLGSLLGVVQIILCVLFPRKGQQPNAESSGDDSDKDTAIKPQDLTVEPSTVMFSVPDSSSEERLELVDMTDTPTYASNK